jgi:Asp-tRNA(Asn)/Glu-tRNA(Gln) amidotransferase A subunit family amidase
MERTRDTQPRLTQDYDAATIAGLVGCGEMTAVEIVESALGHTEAYDAQLNAFTVVSEQAHEEAARVDQRVRRGERLPLAGVPVAVKDHIWVAGLPATNGSRALAEFVPDADCISVARLRAAGAIVIGKTNNPEFCYRGYTESPVWGLTRNPWDQQRTPGGSSGGSAVAVAAGMVPVALGTDGGGSIRIPAAFCGVLGLKPTFGLVPTRPGFRSWKTLSCLGPITRTAADAALVLAVMAGPHPSDDMSVPGPVLDPGPIAAADPSLRGLRVAVSEDFGFARVDPDVRRAFRIAVDHFAELGCELVEAHPPTADPLPMWWTIAAAEGYASEAPLLDRADLMEPDTVEIIRAGQRISSREYLDAQELRADLTREWGEFMERFDLMLRPGEQVLPFPIGLPAPQMADGAPSDPVFEDWWGMDAVANLTGQPAVVVPAGITTTGLPVAIQIVGRRFEDALVLRAASAWERLAPASLILST